MSKFNSVNEFYGSANKSGAIIEAKKKGKGYASHHEDFVSKEDDDVCLNCTRSDCRGGEKCFEKQKMKMKE